MGKNGCKYRSLRSGWEWQQGICTLSECTHPPRRCCGAKKWSHCWSTLPYTRLEITEQKRANMPETTYMIFVESELDKRGSEVERQWQDRCIELLGVLEDWQGDGTKFLVKCSWEMNHYIAEQQHIYDLSKETRETSAPIRKQRNLTNRY